MVWLQALRAVSSRSLHIRQMGGSWSGASILDDTQFQYRRARNNDLDNAAPISQYM